MSAPQQVLMAGGVVQDHLFSDVLVLLSGTKGSLVDASSYARTLTGNNSPAYNNSTRSLFGNPAYHITTSPATRVNCSDSFINGIGSAEFCFEYWIYPVASGVNDKTCSMGSFTAFLYSAGQVSGSFVINSSSYGVGNSGDLRGAWHHIAFVRNNSKYGGSNAKIDMYIDGVLSYSSTAFTNSWSLNGTGLGYLVGYGSGAGDSFEGSLIELRITANQHRYDADFTPPTAPFPTS